MGDATSDPIQLSFNSQLRVEFRGASHLRCRAGSGPDTEIGLDTA